MACSTAARTSSVEPSVIGRLPFMTPRTQSRPEGVRDAQQVGPSLHGVDAARASRSSHGFRKRR